MKTQALIVADDSDLRDWLTRNLGGQVGVLPADHDDPAGLAGEIESTPGVGLVFVQFDAGNALERARLVEHLAERHRELPVVALGQQEDSQAVLAAMRAGARDFLVVHRDDDNLTELVGRVLRRSPRTGTNTVGQGQLLTVFAAAPDARIPFLAMHMALALQTQVGEEGRVLLLDLSLPGGATLVFLDTDQTYGALDALRDVERCDQTLIDTAFPRYDNGLYFLSLPEEVAGPPAIDADQLQRLLETLRGLFEHVVVAADAGISLAPLAAAVGPARQAVLLTDQSVLTSRQNKHMLHGLRQIDCPLDNVGLVLDQVQSRVGLEPDRLAALLDLPYLAGLSGRPQARLESMNAGEPMFEHAPRDAFNRDVLALLEQITGQTVQMPKTGFMSRLFG